MIPTILFYTKKLVLKIFMGLLKHSELFQLVEDGENEASFQMEKDRTLLKELSSFDIPLLRFYRWREFSVTYGYFIDPSKYLNPEKLGFLALKPVRRPTGGGVLFHYQDFPFSLFIPKKYANYSLGIHENYRLINTAILNSIKKLGVASVLTLNEDEDIFHPFCLARPISCDVLIGEKKVGGGALRKTSHGLLYQGSISFRDLPWEKIEQLAIDTEAFSLMRKRSGSLFQKISNEEYEGLLFEFSEILCSQLGSSIIV